MEQHELVKTLGQLQVELSRTDHADPETLELLRKLTADIDRLLDEKQPVSAEDTESVGSGLKELLLKFESDHPQLAITVGKVADALAAIGI